MSLFNSRFAWSAVIVTVAFLEVAANRLWAGAQSDKPASREEPAAATIPNTMAE